MNSRQPFDLGASRVDPATGTLSGPAGERHLTPKLADLLVALARRAGSVATRDELLREVWGERSAVSDEPLTRAVAELRRLLGEVGADAAYLETIPKRGYRVVAPVKVRAPAGAPGTATVPESPAAGTTSPPRSTDLGSARAASERARPRLLRYAVIVVLVVGAAVLIATLAPRTERPAAGPAHRIGVAVLPFADLSPTSDHQYFADGVHEEIIAKLTASSTLRVASRSAVNPYRDTNKGPREIARELGVDAVMEGTVRYADDRVRMTARLVDAATETNVWADVLERPLTLENLFDMQTEIAGRVATGLTRSLSADARASEPAAALPTASLSAYEAFLLGKYHYRRDQPGDIRTAIDQFQSAVDSDATFALAWDWLAYAWLEAGVELGWTTPARAFPRARAAALRALELDPKLATSSSVIGFLRATYDWDWQAGLVELERAAAAAPSETGTVWSYAYVLSALGRHADALAQVRRLAAAVPEDGRLTKEVAERLIDAGLYAEAAQAANAALEGRAEPGQVHELLGIAAYGAGDYATAADELERAVAERQGAAVPSGELAAAYARLGRGADARALLERIESAAAGEELNVVAVARVYAALDERDRALTLLERGVEQRQRDVLFIASDPFFASLREDPRVAKMVERMGLGSAVAKR